MMDGEKSTRGMWVDKTVVEFERFTFFGAITPAILTLQPRAVNCIPAISG